MPPASRLKENSAITASPCRRSFHNTFFHSGHGRTPFKKLLFLCLFPARAFGAAQCSNVAQNAVDNLKAQGTSWMCCSNSSVSCTPWDQTSNCPDDQPVYAQCVNAAGVKACGVNEYGGISTADGAPCGNFNGDGAVQSVQSLQGNGKTPVQIDQAAQQVLNSWPNLGYENYLSLCCTSNSCRMVNPVTYINKNNCTSGEHILKCAGDSTRGICSIWNGDADSGQFFLVNSRPPPPDTTSTRFITTTPSSISLSALVAPPGPSAPSGGDPSSSTSGTASASTDPDTTLSPSPSPVPVPPPVTPIWAVGLIAGLGGMLVFAALAFFWSRGMCGLNPKHRRRVIDPFVLSPPTSAGPPLTALAPRRNPSNISRLAPPQYSPWDTTDGKRMSRSRRYGF